MLRLIFISILFLSLGLNGRAAAGVVEQTYSVQSELQIGDKMRNYCELVCDSWAGISGAYNVKTNTQRVPVSEFKHIPVELKNRNKSISRSNAPNPYISGESDVYHQVRVDKIYYVFALRRIII